MYFFFLQGSQFRNFLYSKFTFPTPFWWALISSTSQPFFPFKTLRKFPEPSPINQKVDMPTCQWWPLCWWQTVGSRKKRRYERGKQPNQGSDLYKEKMHPYIPKLHHILHVINHSSWQSKNNTTAWRQLCNKGSFPSLMMSLSFKCFQTDSKMLRAFHLKLWKIWQTTPHVWNIILW